MKTGEWVGKEDGKMTGIVGRPYAHALFTDEAMACLGKGEAYGRDE